MKLVIMILNIKKGRYEPHYRYIRDERKDGMNQYVNDCSKLPLSLVYRFKEPEDQISILNKHFSDCLEIHAPARRVKLTRPIAPWMKDLRLLVIDKIRTISNKIM